MGPCHLYFVIADSAGNQSRSAKVRLTRPGSSSLVTETLYLDENLHTQTPADFTCDGIVSLWSEGPMRVDMAVQSYDVGNMFLPGMDFLSAPENTIAGGSRVRVRSLLAQPGDLFTQVSPGDASFLPVDTIAGHYHVGRAQSSVALVPLGLTPGDPIARVVADPIATLPGVGGDLVSPSVLPSDMPRSVDLLKRVPRIDLWSDTFAEGVAETGESLNEFAMHDPQGVGLSVLLADRSNAIGNRLVLVGNRINASYYRNQIEWNPFFGLPTNEYLGGGVAIGSSIAYDPRSVHVVGDDSASGSEVGHFGVAIGAGFQWYPVNYWRDNVMLGNGYASFADYGDFEGVLGHDTIVGRPGAGIYDDYARVWGITTILAADAGFPQDGGHLTPTGPVDTTNHIRNNDSWIYTERYFEWIRLGLDVSQANWASAPIVRNTIIPRAAVPPSDLNYERADWYAWNIAAQNVFSRVQPIADRDDYYNGLLLVTQANPTIPGSFQVDDGVTLAAPLHDGVGGTPSALGFYGHTPAVRTLVTDNASIPALTSLITALSNLGLILTPGGAVVQDDFAKPRKTAGHALTGQSPVGFPIDDANLGTVGGALVRQPWGGTDVGFWSAALYYTDIFDVLVTTTVATWGSADDGVIIRAIPDSATFASSRGHNYDYALLAAKTGLYLRTNTGTKTLLAAYSSNMANGDIMTVQAIARAVTVKKNGSTVLTFTLPDDLGGRMHGLALTTGTVFNDLTIAHP